MEKINHVWYLNMPLIASFFGWVIAQTIKLIILILKSNQFDFSIYLSTGGMPSAHSAMVTSLTTSIGFYYGFNSPFFAISAVFALIVMFDAQSVRKSVGLQAQVLNRIVDEITKDKKISLNKIKELLGHTRFEVFVGMIIGIVIGYLSFILFKK